MSEELVAAVRDAIRETTNNHYGYMLSAPVANTQARAAIEAVRAFDARREPVQSEPVEPAPPAEANQVERVARAMSSVHHSGAGDWDRLWPAGKHQYRDDARRFLAALKAVGLGAFPMLAAGQTDAELDQAIKSEGTRHMVRNVHVAPRRPDGPDLPSGAVAETIEKIRSFILNDGGPRTVEAYPKQLMLNAANMLADMLGTFSRIEEVAVGASPAGIQGELLMLIGRWLRDVRPLPK